MIERRKQDKAQPAADKCAAGTENAARRLRSTELFEGTDQLIIEHAGREYRLRVTSNGKLILTA